MPAEAVAETFLLRLQILRTVFADDLDACFGQPLYLVEGDVLAGAHDRLDIGTDLLAHPAVCSGDLSARPHTR